MPLFTIKINKPIVYQYAAYEIFPLSSFLAPMFSMFLR